MELRATNLDVNVMTVSHWVGAATAATDAAAAARDSLGLNDAVGAAAVQQQRCPAADPNLHRSVSPLLRPQTAREEAR